METTDLGNPKFEHFSYHVMNLLKEYPIISLNLSFKKGILKIKYIDVDGKSYVDKDYPKGYSLNKMMKQFNKDMGIIGDVRKWMK